MVTPNWFQKGEAGIKTADQKMQEQKIRFEQRVPFKFKVEVGKNKKGTFLDDPDFFFSVHSVKNVRGGFDDITCINDFDTCPICASGQYPSYALLATVIDHEGYINKDGVKRLHTKQLAMFKSGAQKKLLRRKEDLKLPSLAGCCFTFARDGKKECATGEDIQFFKQFTPNQMLQMAPKDIIDKGQAEIVKHITPYDYAKIFAPRTKEELSALIGAPPPVGAQDNSGVSSVFQEPAQVGSNSNQKTPEDGDIDDLLNG